MEIGVPLYRCDQARAIDSAAQTDEGIAGYELMTRAAQAALEVLLARWPQVRSIAVVCGAGNNGGDGFVLARLARALGMEVEVLALASAPGSADAQRARADWEAAGGAVHDPAAAALLPRAELVVDALFGIGLTRAPAGDAAALIAAINACGRPVLALDLPSGLDADRGTTPGDAVRATVTVCFIVAKCGLHTGRGRVLCGEIVPAPLQVPAAIRSRAAPAARLLRATDLGRFLAPRARDAHKGHHGHVLCIGGEQGYAGAILLCAEAALRAGAGLVSVGTRAAHVAAMLAARPEVMARAVESLDDLAPLAARASALAIGPGLGQEAWGRALLRALRDDARPRVFDADALTLLAQQPAALPGAVLTPHPGEAARLLASSVAAIENDRFAAAAALAARYACAVVLKGAGSVVAAPGECAVVIDAGNPGMAGGGMGDVLTGVIAALLAQGLAPFEAACCGALLHAAAGDDAARDGERGMIASDLFAPLRRRANPAC